MRVVGRKRNRKLSSCHSEERSDEESNAAAAAKNLTKPQERFFASLRMTYPGSLPNKPLQLPPPE